MSKLADSLAGAALRLAEAGWFVLALQREGKAPAISRGVKNATRDPILIERWWQRGEHNIGIAAGAASNLSVIDIDNDHAAKTLAQAALVHGGLPTTVTSRTPRGYHLYFQHAHGLRNRVHVAGLGVDLRSDDGYVVAPPSRLSISQRYSWLRSPWTTPVAAMPQWLCERLRGQQTPSSARASRATGPHHRYGMGALRREAEALASTPTGARNDALNRSAFRMGTLIDPCCVSEAEIVRQLIQACTTNGLLADDGLRAVLATVESGLRAGRAKPRRIAEAAERP